MNSGSGKENSSERQYLRKGLWFNGGAHQNSYKEIIYLTFEFVRAREIKIDMNRDPGP